MSASSQEHTSTTSSTSSSSATATASAAAPSPLTVNTTLSSTIPTAVSIMPKTPLSLVINTTSTNNNSNFNGGALPSPLPHAAQQHLAQLAQQQQQQHHQQQLLNLQQQQQSHLLGTNVTQTIYAGGNDEITTIFVVGFPEDIQEREFQNMFMFAPGFEAATLKFPTNFDADDGIPQYKKQIIGFVKFRTRIEALQARDHISGRKVDAERGCVLKAEIAKKNLHTKRGISNDFTSAQFASAFTPVGATNPMTPLTPMNPTPGPLSNLPLGAGTAPLATPTTVPVRRILTSKDLALSDGFPKQTNGLNSPIPKDILLGGNGSMALSSFSAFDFYSTPPPDADVPILNRKGSPPDSDSSNPDLSFRLISDSLDFKPPSSVVANVAGSRAAFPETSESFNAMPLSFNRNNERGFSSALFSSESLLSHRLTPTLTINTKVAPSLGAPSAPVFPASNPIASNPTGNSPPPSAPAVSPTSFGPGFRQLADQNPPCNTLYVGNLPANTNENELRNLFSRCLGYKRLSYRVRPNGPMCFVEFEDVECAQLALNELHGSPLSNSVKGGIRLSFSKNPLGIRQQSTPQSSSAVLNLMNGLDKDANRLVFSC